MASDLLPIPITLSGRPVHTVFDLLGQKENDLTFAVGWGLASCPPFARALLADVLGTNVGLPTAIKLQQAGGDRGYTDIEVLAEDAHLIIEAKRGWHLPTEKQLLRYAPRLSSTTQVLLAITECSPAFARRHLPGTMNGIPVKHRSWSHIATLAEQQRRSGTHAQKRLLRELHTYLKGVMTAQDNTSNWTYVVSLNRAHPLGGSISFLDVVLKKNKYFHPYGVGSGWPKVPPNYLAFRWDGKVRRIHHVEDYTVVDDLNEIFDDIPRGQTQKPHIVYSLGPAILLDPPRAVGASIRNARRWVALDLLLTSSTLQEAYEKTRARRIAQPAEPE